jgi:peptide/nickel transport system substrate-binding protein
MAKRIALQSSPSSEREVRRPVLIGLVTVILLAACTGGDGPVTPTGEPPRRGGTLRLVTPGLAFSSLSDPEGRVSALDPALEYEVIAWEVLRCCLVRTLLSYTGELTRDGGGELRPDLAADLPNVSPDGLTWTFRLRRGLRYAPPLERVEITAGDFIRAFEREGRLGAAGYSFYYSPIEGFDAFARGDAAAISGLEAPDDHSLVIRLRQPQGDLGHRLALPAIAPIPPRPGDPSAPFGAASGHDDGYGRFLVASGPYMIEGSQDLDLAAPSEDAKPVAGLEPGRRLTLVRNPSWDTASDPLRPAYVDRIELRARGTRDEAHSQLERGEVDLVFASGPPPQAPADLVARYRADPGLGRVEIVPRDFLFAITMNVAVPPFDDVRVRRAVNLIIDKAALIEHAGGHLTGRVATHIATDGVEDNLLAAYDPYRPTDSGPDIDRARREMASATRYDRDGDGSCDVPACRNILALELDFTVPRPLIGALLQRDLARIGIHASPRSAPSTVFFERLADPSEHVALGINAGWGKDFVNASSFLASLFRSSNLGLQNYSLLGASNEQLRGWGYAVRNVPNVDARIDQCTAMIGGPQTECWATLDQYLMEEVVPYVPLRVDHQVQVVPKRITAFSFNQFTVLPALDRIAVES